MDADAAALHQRAYDLALARFGDTFTTCVCRSTGCTLSFRNEDAARAAAAHFREASVRGVQVFIPTADIGPRAVAWPRVDLSMLMRLLFFLTTVWYVLQIA
jgi:hypothetical protein